jgi:bacillithiol system protein YtxJ
MKLILKHSFRCPISARARGEVERFLKRHEKEGKHRLAFELVDVIDNRARADEIASQTGIQHKSPQVMLFDDEVQLIWHASHRDITREALWEAVEEKEEE